MPFPPKKGAPSKPSVAGALAFAKMNAPKGPKLAGREEPGDRPGHCPGCRCDEVGDEAHLDSEED